MPPDTGASGPRRNGGGHWEPIIHSIGKGGRVEGSLPSSNVLHFFFPYRTPGNTSSNIMNTELAHLGTCPSVRSGE